MHLAFIITRADDLGGAQVHVRDLCAGLGSGQAESAVLAAFVAACMAGILVNGAVIDVNHWRHFWLLLAMAWWCPITPAEERSAYAPGVYHYARG